MTRKLFFSLIATIAAASCLAVCSLAMPSSASRQEFRELMQKTQPTNSREPAAPYIAKHQREQIAKEILLADNRKTVLIFSHDAELECIHGEEQNELVEHLHDVACYMQEELFYQLEDGREVILHPCGRYFMRGGSEENPLDWIQDGIALKPMQMVRYMEADHALFYYQTDVLSAQTVTLKRYIWPGHDLKAVLNQPAHLLLSGTADQMQCKLAGDPVFKASGFKGTWHAAEKW